jgi:hypothetical protein
VQTCMDKDAWSSWHSPSISLPYVPSILRQKREHDKRAWNKADVFKKKEKIRGVRSHMLTK